MTSDDFRVSIDGSIEVGSAPSTTRSGSTAAAGDGSSGPAARARAAASAR
jgi:hypothetical protein